MKKRKKKYCFINKVSAVCMLFSLLWLTVSAPFIFSAQQQLCKSECIENSSPAPVTEEDATNPFGNNSEEKASFGSSFSEEYLHDSHAAHHFITEILQHFSKADSGTYLAYHGELDVPPPDVI